MVRDLKAHEVLSGAKREEEVGNVPRKTSHRTQDIKIRMVDFDFQNHAYQIDPQRQKVYRRFVEVETSKAFEIYTLWRSSHLSA